MDGILLVDKEKGISSFQVIRRLKGYLKENGIKTKIGHAGTLDPFATGLLIILLGKATKLSNSFIGLDKSYEFTIEFGYETTTLDPEGDIVKQVDLMGEPTLDDCQYTINLLVGKQEQMPPDFSAKKINGQPAYKLARQGKEVKLKSKEIEIYSIREVNREWPKITFETKVSSGTYIRVLAKDIAHGLGILGTAIELRRTSIDKYNLVNALKSEQILPELELDKYLINI